VPGLQQTARRTQFETVRFGNVLGSAGSVIPKFKQQIAKGGPVTVAHPEITRFFMTIPEARNWCCKRRAWAVAARSVSWIGEPVRIVDLAPHLSGLYGFSGSRSGSCSWACDRTQPGLRPMAGVCTTAN
jgi:FlaA1/EpsC-like NDP-sugar epimerase